MYVYVYIYTPIKEFLDRMTFRRRLWIGRCTLVDRALHACGLGAKDIYIYIYIYIPLRTPIGLPIKGRLIMGPYIRVF